jgi:hypothetical protein
MGERSFLYTPHTCQHRRLSQLVRMPLNLAISTAFGSSTRASKRRGPPPTMATITSCLKKHSERYLEPEAFAGPPAKRAELNEREGSTLIPVKAIVEPRVTTKGRFRDSYIRRCDHALFEACIAKPSAKTLLTAIHHLDARYKFAKHNLHSWDKAALWSKPLFV